MSKIDKVAKAIYDKRNGTGVMPWGRRDMAHKAPYIADAIAALEALRIPSIRMAQAGKDAAYCHTEVEDVAEVFTACIDAALNEQVSG